MQNIVDKNSVARIQNRLKALIVIKQTTQLENGQKISIDIAQRKHVSDTWKDLIREMETQTIMSSTHSLVEKKLQKWKTLNIIVSSIGDNMKHSHSGSLAVSYEVKHSLTTWPSIPNPRYLFRINETYAHKKFCMWMFIATYT